MLRDERKDLYGLVRLELMAYMDAQKSCSKATHDIVDMICDAIDAQRCVWTIDKDGRMAKTGCGEELWHILPFDIKYTPFCACCGKRIEVKEG